MNISPYILLSVIPGLGFLLSLLFKSIGIPFWQYADPCYIYLINALHFLQGLPQTEIEHPGSTLQLLISGVIAVTHLDHLLIKRLPLS
jgi:hypothetical protein